MTSIDDLPVNEAIALYYEKHNAVKEGDLNKLIALRKKIPELFIKEKDDEIGIMLICIEIIKGSSHYKELCKREAKSKFRIIES